MYAVYFRIKISFQSKHCNSVVFKFFVHIAYGFLYIILTGFPLANIPLGVQGGPIRPPPLVFCKLLEKTSS